MNGKTQALFLHAPYRGRKMALIECHFYILSRCPLFRNSLLLPICLPCKDKLLRRIDMTISVPL